MISVLVAGKFDPPHDGHILHIVEASALGDYLYVVTHTDSVLEKVKPTGCQVPLWARMTLLRGILLLYGIKGEVIISDDEDGTVAQTLKDIRPDIFAKGGDRTPDNMPQSELDVCEEIGCRIVYGVGEKVNSSSGIKI